MRLVFHVFFFVAAVNWIPPVVKIRNEGGEKDNALFFVHNFFAKNVQEIEVKI